MVTELEPLCTPVVTCTPGCTTYTSSFVFTYPEADSFPSCAAAHRKGSSSNEPSSDSLSSPTLLALWAVREGKAAGIQTCHCPSWCITERRNTSSLEGSRRPREDLTCSWNTPGCGPQGLASIHIWPPVLTSSRDVAKTKQNKTKNRMECVVPSDTWELVVSRACESRPGLCLFSLSP